MSWTLQIAIFIAVYLGISWYQSRRAISVGSAFPELPATTATGQTWDWSALGGRPVLVHVWATWCSVCRREFPTLDEIAAAPPDGTAVISIVEDGGDVERIQAFVEAQGIHYPVLRGSPELMQRLGVTAYPTNFYLSGDHTVQAVTVGMSTKWGMWLRMWWLR